MQTAKCSYKQATAALQNLDAFLVVSCRIGKIFC